MTRCIRASLTAVAGLAAAGLTMALPGASQAAHFNARQTHSARTGAAVTTADRSLAIESDEERTRGMVDPIPAVSTAAQQGAPFDRHLYSN
jgi:hypothetical protein